MTITVSVHNILPVTVVTYRKDMARADLDEFMAYFRDPDLFPLANDAIIIVEEGTSFNDLPLKEMLKVAKEMEKISLQHQKKGHTLPDVVTIVIKSPSQRVMGRLWIGLTDLVPGLKPKYKVCKTVGDACELSWTSRTSDNGY